MSSELPTDPQGASDLQHPSDSISARLIPEEDNVAIPEAVLVADFKEKKYEGAAKDDLEYARKKRKLIQCGLLVLYVLICTLVPVLSSDTVSCNAGFWWETHMSFFASFLLNKLMEVYLYATDPSIDGELPVWQFFLLFIPSFVGYSDGYQDATAIQVATACAVDPDAKVDKDLANTLSFSMFYTFWIGVVGAQWIFLAAIAIAWDESGAVIAKLVHMDALAQCVDVQQMWMWYMISAIRLFGEDLPQAYQQFFFVWYVKQNWFMIISIVFSVCCSLKAMMEAFMRSAEATGLLELAKKWRREHAAVDANPEYEILAPPPLAPPLAEIDTLAPIDETTGNLPDTKATGNVQVIYVERVVEITKVVTIEVFRQSPQIERQYVQKHVAKPIIQFEERVVDIRDPHSTVRETRERVIEVPQIQQCEVIKQVGVPAFQQVVKEVPKIEIQTVERIIEVPCLNKDEIQVQYVEKPLEIPTIQVVEKEVMVPKVIVEEQIVEVPQHVVVDVIRQVNLEAPPGGPEQWIDKPVPKVELQCIERVEEVSFHLIQEVVVEVPQASIVEVRKEVPVNVIREVVVEVPQAEVQYVNLG